MKSILVLMVLFIALGSFAIFDPFRLKEKQELSRDREARVAWLEGTNLESIRLQTPKGEVEFACAKPEGCAYDGTADWQLRKPVQDLADPSSVGSLASALLNLVHNDRIELEQEPDPKEFGFDQPAAEIELRLKGVSQPHIFRVGRNSSVGPNVYIWNSYSPKRVFLVPAHFVQQVQKDLFHWRNKLFFPKATPEEVVALEWAQFRAEKAGPWWALDKPIRAKGNHVMIEGLVSTLVRASAKAVFAGDRQSPEAKRVLAGKPVWDLVAKRASGEPLRLRLFAKPGNERAGNHVDFIAAADGVPVLYVTEAVQFSRFGKPVGEYRERKLRSGGEPPDEMVFTFPREKKTVTYKLAGDTWQHAAGEAPAEAVSQNRIIAFYDAVTGADVKEFWPSGTRQANAFRNGPIDAEVELRVGGNSVGKFQFVIFDRKTVLTGGELPGETREMDATFAKLLPVRPQDFYESANKQVVTSKEAEEDESGQHSHDEHGHDSHDGHAH